MLNIICHWGNETLHHMPVIGEMEFLKINEIQLYPLEWPKSRTIPNVDKEME